MKYRHPLLAASAMAGVLSVVSLASCSDKKDVPEYPDDLTFKQVLRVEQWNDGETNALADFMVVDVHTQKEISVQLPSKSSVTANGLAMKYYTPNPDDPGSYAYAVTIPGTPQEVTFAFTRMPGVVLTNTINISDVPFIRLTPGATVKNGVKYAYTSSKPEATTDNITIALIAKDGDNANKWYRAEIHNGEYMFTDVPPGNYVLRSIATVSFDFLMQPNGTSGGERRGSKVYQINTVKVE